MILSGSVPAEALVCQLIGEHRGQIFMDQRHSEMKAFQQSVLIKTLKHFWAATAHSIDKDGQSLPEGSGLRFTTDYGQTWNSIPQPLDSQTDTIEVYGNNSIRALPVTVAVQNLIYDIAFTPNTIWIATFAGGLRKARIDSLRLNQSLKWQRVLLPPDYLNSIKPTDTLNFCLQPVAGKFCSEDNLNHQGIFSYYHQTIRHFLLAQPEELTNQLIMELAGRNSRIQIKPRR